MTWQNFSGWWRRIFFFLWTGALVMDQQAKPCHQLGEDVLEVENERRNLNISSFLSVVSTATAIQSVRESEQRERERKRRRERECERWRNREERRRSGFEGLQELFQTAAEIPAPTLLLGFVFLSCFPESWSRVYTCIQEAIEFYADVNGSWNCIFIAQYYVFILI